MAPAALTYIAALQTLHLMPGWPVGLWTSDQPDTFGRLMQVMCRPGMSQPASILLLELLSLQRQHFIAAGQAAAWWPGCCGHWRPVQVDVSQLGLAVQARAGGAAASGAVQLQDHNASAVQQNQGLCHLALLG